VASWLLVFASRLHGLLRPRPLDDDFDREMASHVEALTEANLRRGMPLAEARRAARLKFGGPMQVKERHRESRTLPLVETAVGDAAYAMRMFRKHPAFSFVAVSTLAVGIGAGTTVFGVVRAVLLRPLPYDRPGALVRIYETNPLRNWTRNIAAPANWADWRARNASFEDIAAYEQFTATGSGANRLSLTGFGEPQGLKALGVSGNLFAVLGAPPLLGRTFTDDEQWEGASQVAVLSYGLWQGAFGGDPAIVGRTITLSGRGYTVVGVMPRGFFFPGRDVQLWTPFGYTRELVASSRRPHWLGVVARLKPSVTLRQAADNMAAVAARLEAEYPDTNTRMGVRLERLHDSFAREPRLALLMLSGAVGLLFLLVCANIASLQLGRAIARSRELAIRQALGAARGRLLRQLFTESIVLSLAGGGLGLASAAVAQTMLARYAESLLPLFAEVRTDASVVLAAIALSLGAPIVFGVVPALAPLHSTHVNERAESASRRTHTLRSLLVAGEVALSIVLAVGAVLLVRSLLRLQDVDPGFRPDHTVAFTVTLPSARYPDAAARFRAFTGIGSRLREQPGIESAGATSTLALRGYTWSGDTTLENRSVDDYERDTRHVSVTPEYFQTTGVRLLAGRLFDETDTRDRPPVTIVNQTLAQAYFPGLPMDRLIARRIAFGRPQDQAPWNEIVGVVADEKQEGLDRPAGPTAYSSTAQRQQNPMTFVVRSAQEPQAAIASARRAVAAVDKDLAITDVTTLDQVVAESTADYRFRTTLLSAFAAVALLLAALGIYGVLAYFVSQRSRELGIRLALGARPDALFRFVVGQGMRPVMLGTLTGLVGAAALTSSMRSLLFGISPIDWPAYTVAIAGLALVALGACAVPARRASTLDPLTALRNE
jgi:predicted permease